MSSVFANIPGGGTGTGANITLASTSTTATMSNGIVSIVMTKSSAQITTINYTFNNTGSSQTLNLLSGNPNGGKLYWEHSNNQGLVFTYAVVADPSTNGGDYAEVALYSTTQANMPFAVHYSMRRGSPGFYVTAIWTHDSTNGAFGMGECRNNIYAGSIFNWMSVDATRNKLMQVSGGTSIGVPTAPVECSLWTNGIYQGRYEDKYKYSAHLGDQRVWGWSSVGAGGKNVGLWDVSATSEYYNGGPLHAELMCHIGTTILNMFNGNHYEMGTDGSFVAGETWGKVCGPYFVYCNNVPSTVTDPVQASQALYNDALAQGTAEASAWPYSWFNNANYAGPADRGTVRGKIVIDDPSNPNATAANLWVGLVQQPVTSTGTYDFQQWMKPYQFWVHTDADGNFTVPAVIAGSNYTLYAFGQGANGTFMSQAQTGGSPPFLENISASPFSVTVTGGATTALGNITWTPTRVGPTVFEIGYPDRTGRKFKHGEDWWVGDIGPSPTSPSPVWSKWMEFPVDFPTEPNYVVGTSRWSTDWNFVQPVVYSSTGTWNSSSSTITFNLASAPVSGTQASIYLGIASDYYTALIMTVNGTNLGGSSGPIAGVTATPSNLPSTGFVPTSSKSNSTLREGINGAFSDQRISFPGTLLKAGTNTIKIAQRQAGGSYFADHAMYDYLRLELTGYVPPVPAGVTAFAGNNNALVTWPVVPGATSYKVLRSTVSGSGYVTVATGVTGPVSGSGPTHATYVDSAVSNGTTYYYVVQSTNPVNSSANSAQSAGVTPSSGVSVSAPAAPAGLTATPGSSAVTLNWTASAGANLYTVKRSTLTYNGGGTTIPLNTIILTNSVSGTTYADTSVTNGTLYSYSISATNSSGSGVESAAATTTPRASAPTAAPTNVTAVALKNSNSGQILLNWSAVPGAVGYVVQLATSLNGPYGILATLSSLTTTDYSLSPNTTYYYQVATMNSGGTSAFVTVSATTPPAAPTSPVATPGSSKVTLTWTAPAGATGYVISRATVAGGPYTSIANGITAASYQDATVLNGVTYYYVIAATGAGGTGDVSTEASATPVGVPSLVWNGNLSANWDTATANWLVGSSASLYADGNNVILNDTATTTSVNISGTVSPNSILVDTAGTYSLSGAGSITGSSTLDKSGAGTLTVSSAHSYGGGTTIQGGTVLISNAASLGTGPVTLSGGTWATGTLSPQNAIVVTADSTITGGDAGGLHAVKDISGSGVLTLNATGAFDLEGDVSGFSGRFAMTGSGSFRFFSAASSGSSSATFDLGTRGLSARSGSAFNLGALVGQAGSSLGMASNSTATGCVYTIGENNADSIFAGIIANGGASKLVGIVKTGSGTQTLSGINTYTGPTTVSSGKLSVTGSLAATPVTVATTGTLGGIGSLAGTVACNGTLAPGVSVGTLTFGNGLALASTSTLTFDLGTTSDRLNVTGNLTLDGTVNITAAPGFSAGTYTLATYTTLTNNALNVGTLPAGYIATVTATGGQVNLVVVSTANTAPQITVGPIASGNPVTATTTNLSVTATDDGGEGNLIYTWSATGPAAVSFSSNVTNAAKNAVATFSAAGSYALTVTARDVPGLTAANSINVTVNATPTTLTVSPSNAAFAVSATQSFTATVLDQFGDPISNPSVTWSTSGGGLISTGGLYTASTAGGPYQVSATSGNASSSASVTVTKATPTVSAPPAASAITYGQALSSSSLTGGAASVAGAFAFTTPGTIPNAGTASQAVTFTPTDSSNYNTASTTASVTVNKATATVTLGSLSAIYDGTAKSATATTTPGGLTVSYTYDGFATKPIEVGTYAVVGTVNDANYAGSATGSFVITQQPASSFSAWEAAKFTPAQIAAGESATTADPDHDGLTNLAEYALGAQPYAFTPQPSVTTGSTSMSISFQRPAGISDVTYHAEAGNDFTTWSELSLEVLTPGSDPETVRAVHTLPDPRPGKTFLRLRFEK